MLNGLQSLIIPSSRQKNLNPSASLPKKQIQFGIDTVRRTPISQYIDAVLQAGSYHAALDRMAPIFHERTTSADRLQALRALISPQAPETVRTAAFRALLTNYVHQDGELPEPELKLLDTFINTSANAHYVADNIQFALANDYPVESRGIRYGSDPTDHTLGRFGSVIPLLAVRLQGISNPQDILQHLNIEVQGKFWTYLLENNLIPQATELPSNLLNQLAQQHPEQAVELFSAWNQSSTAPSRSLIDDLFLGVMKSGSKRALEQLLFVSHQIKDDEDWEVAMRHLTKYIRDNYQSPGVVENFCQAFITSIPREGRIREAHAQTYIEFLKLTAEVLSNRSGYSGKNIIDALPRVLPERLRSGARLSILEILSEARSKQAKAYAKGELSRS